MVWTCKQNASGKTTQKSFACQTNRRRPVKRPKTRSTNYIEELGWNCLGFYPSKMMDVMEDSKVWWLNLELLPLQPLRKSGQGRKKKNNKDKIIATCLDLQMTVDSIIERPLPLSWLIIIYKYCCSYVLMLYCLDKINL